VIALSPHEDGAILQVIAQPGAKRDTILGERAGALRVAVTAPPEKGKANQAIQELLAEALACRRNQVTLLSGASSRRKRFLIGGFTFHELSDRIAQAIPEPRSGRSSY
jgi:uncharacterized protein (TIGR00251 family)